jgi:hypothetical protein
MKIVENFRPTVTQPKRRFIALNPLPSVQIGPYFDRSDVYYVFLALVLSLPTSLQWYKMYHVLNKFIILGTL